MNEKFKYSLIFQGLIDSEFDVENLLLHLKFTDDIILSTWENSIQETHLKALTEKGIKVVECKDPGSSKAYSEGNIQKYLNVSRRLKGFNIGCKLAKYEYVIFTRTDLKFNVEKAFWYYINSKKIYAITNVNSICPNRMFAPKYYASLCDWIFIGSKNYFLKKTSFEVNESLIQQKEPQKIQTQNWNSILSSEQLFSIVFLGEVDRLHTYSNFSEEGLLELKKLHLQLIYHVYLIKKEFIGLKSFKYKHFTQNWISYQKWDFSDNGFLAKNIWDLCIFLLARVKYLLKR